jgi:acetyl-CoA synthetase
MMGNEVALWEIMLAAIKIGAVLIPAAPNLAGADLLDRLRRGKVHHVLTNAGGMAKFDELDAAALSGINRIVAGAAPAADSGWVDFANSEGEPRSFNQPEPTLASDPLFEYFTSGTTAKPKLVQHTQVSDPVGHWSTMYCWKTRPLLPQPVRHPWRAAPNGPPSHEDPASCRVRPPAAGSQPAAQAPAHLV